MSSPDGIQAFHWASLGSKSWETEGQLFAVWPEPVNRDACFEAAGFTAFSDQGDRWDDDYERFMTDAVVALGEHGDVTIHGGVPAAKPSLMDRVRGKQPQVMTPLQQLLWAVHDDNAPCRLEFGTPAKAFVQVADGHEIIWIWLHASVAPTWPTLVRLLAGNTRLVQTQLEWKHLLPKQLE